MLSSPSGCAYAAKGTAATHNLTSIDSSPAAHGCLLTGGACAVGPADDAAGAARAAGAHAGGAGGAARGEFSCGGLIPAYAVWDGICACKQSLVVTRVSAVVRGLFLYRICCLRVTPTKHASLPSVPAGPHPAACPLCFFATRRTRRQAASAWSWLRLCLQQLTL